MKKQIILLVCLFSVSCTALQASPQQTPTLAPIPTATPDSSLQVEEYKDRLSAQIKGCYDAGDQFYAMAPNLIDPYYVFRENRREAILTFLDLWDDTCTSLSTANPPTAAREANDILAKADDEARQFSSIFRSCLDAEDLEMCIQAVQHAKDMEAIWLELDKPQYAEFYELFSP